MSLAKEIKYSKLPFFFVDQDLQKKQIVLPPETVHHLKVKRKLAPLQEIYLSNNKDLAKGQLVYSDKRQLLANIKITEPCQKREKKTYLYASLIKEECYSLIVEKAVELGIDVIVPLISEYTQHKKLNKEKMLKKIALAAGQSRQSTLPFLGETTSVSQFDIQAFSHVIVADWKESSLRLPTPFSSQGGIALLTGPEGGWSPLEKQQLSGAHHLCLSPHILRAETAAIALMSLTLFAINK